MVWKYLRLTSDYAFASPGHTIVYPYSLLHLQIVYPSSPPIKKVIVPTTSSPWCSFSRLTYLLGVITAWFQKIVVWREWSEFRLLLHSSDKLH
jgi:hypothetical protein